MIRNVAIMGATGAVGQEILSILEERNFPLQSLKLLASERSAGKEFKFKGETLKCEVLNRGRAFQIFRFSVQSWDSSLLGGYAASEKDFVHRFRLGGRNDVMAGLTRHLDSKYYSL